MTSVAFELAVRKVEQLAAQGRAQWIDGGTFVRGVVDAFLAYLDEEDPRDDPLLLVEYAAGWAEGLADVRLFADRLLVGELVRQLEWCLARQGRRVEFESTLSSLRAGLAEGDDDARNLLQDLCRDGMSSHPRWFAGTGWSMEVLKLAYDHGLVAPLDAALRPPGPGRLAAIRWSSGEPYWTALSFLGHLAADPVHTPRASAARCALAELAAFPEVGADAAVRLPPHLVGHEERQRLLEALDRLERFAAAPVGDGIDPTWRAREVEIVRTVLWQVGDCARVGIPG